jgi:quinolinate synthase
MSNEMLFEEIKKLKKEKDAVILAHYYVEDEVQKIADYVGDSFYLAKIATTLNHKVICFCGVSFMGESAKILNPSKTVIMPDATADCPMAHMATVEKIESLRKKYDDLAVVCYVNSTAELKMHSDVCVTSSNALDIVRAMPNHNIFFIPDKNLGGYVKMMVPEKNIILNDGYCPIHNEITLEDVKKAKSEHPNALLLVHPECVKEVCDVSDYVGSTKGIIAYANKSTADEFIIGTEIGVFYELIKNNPDKKFYRLSNMICPDMKKISLEKVKMVLSELSNEVVLNQQIIEKGKTPLVRMLEMA